jgi:putative transposase
MLATFREVCDRFGCDLTEAGREPDHAHLLVAYPPKVTLSVLAQYLKGLSSRRVRSRRFPEVTRKLWGAAFWSPAYCAVSCGGAPLATVEAYVKAQRGEPASTAGAAPPRASLPLLPGVSAASKTGAKNR